ncbi:MAG: glutamine-hydrolyzing carbamoyl-phosphate synthase small subunit [Legionellales bacterium]|nr:glutamine-hydrolyzing carbamoyl-phosphate synthase small subunit [Legionellales bacterium]
MEKILMTTAYLVLADGLVFEGESVGVEGVACGEVVFNTAQYGYQEIMTDPSYLGQMIVFTQPHIGNTGINQADMESEKAWVSGVVLHNYSLLASNYRSEETLGEFFQRQNKVAISEVDTRALTHHLRDKGSQAGCIMTGELNYEHALQQARAFEGLAGKDLAQKVSTTTKYAWNEGSFFATKVAPKPSSPHVIVYDFGVKYSILRQLIDAGATVTVVPANTSVDEVLTLQPDGIVLSNGPGDPAACTYAIEATKRLLNKGIPLMGICLGHQILALASGAVTEKMKLGHHGANHPIINLQTDTVAISSQNHGFVVSEKNFPANLVITARSLFDNTVAGIARVDVPAFGFQGHPEAGPGPTELNSLFRDYMRLIHFQLKAVMPACAGMTTTNREIL